MTCLFCGKDIGPFRIFRDDEFCCDQHRRLYSERLGKAILGMGGLAPAPPVSDFRPLLSPKDGNTRPVFPQIEHEFQVREGLEFHAGPPEAALWPTVPAHAIEHARLGFPEPAERDATPSARLQLSPRQGALPGFRVGIAERERKRRGRDERVPPACGSWMALAEPQAGAPESDRVVAGPVAPSIGAEPFLPAAVAGELPIAPWLDPAVVSVPPDAAPAAPPLRPVETARRPPLLPESILPQPSRVLAPASATTPIPPVAAPSMAAVRPAETAPQFPLLPETILPKAVQPAAICGRPAPTSRAKELSAEPVAADRPALVSAPAPVENAERPLPAPPPSAIAPAALPDAEWRTLPEPRPAAAPTAAAGTAPEDAAWPAAAEIVPPCQALHAAAPPAAAPLPFPAEPVESVPALPSSAPAAAQSATAGAIRLPSADLPLRARMPAGAPLLAEALRPWSPADAAPFPNTEPQSTAAALELPEAGRLPSVAGPGPLPRRAPEPEPVECAPLALVPAPCPVVSAAQPLLPEFRTSRTPELAVASFGDHGPQASPPEPREPNTKAAKLVPISTVEVQVPFGENPPGETGLPQAAFIAVDFYLARAASTPTRRIEWQSASLPLVAPAFGLRVAGEDRVEPAPPPRPEPKASPAEVFTLPEARRRFSRRKLSHFARIAACLMVASCVWLGIQTVKVLTPVGSMDTLAVNDGPVPADAPAAVPRSTPPAKPPAGAEAEAQASSGVLARMRRAIAGRAATSVGDTLRNGMEAWGAAPKRYAPGWARHPDGYARPGELALFQPSMSYADYRLEFFGQIETRGMGWAMRAQDRQNYYAMKLTLVEGGLRPVIALEHYPVVGGVKGHAISTPLSVMVHRNTPFRVAVDVRGNRMTASIEGQRVDSWKDDLLSTGGVGFFSEAGERARLYWMKVLRNQDMLGSICSFLSGGTNDSAVLRPDWPADWPRPSAPHPVESAVAEFDFGALVLGAARPKARAARRGPERTGRHALATIRALNRNGAYALPAPGAARDPNRNQRRIQTWRC